MPMLRESYANPLLVEGFDYWCCIHCVVVGICEQGSMHASRKASNKHIRQGANRQPKDIHEPSFTQGCPCYALVLRPRTAQQQ